MRPAKSLYARLFFLLSLLCALAPLSFAQINIVTERYDQSRLGANLKETQLNISNVNVNTFGKLWSYQVSGSVHAQPLYVQNVTIPGKGAHNVLYVVTMNDVVYAFDADSSSNTPMLSLDLTTQVAGSTPVPITDLVSPNLNIVGNVGIESTPYIDLSTNTMYLVARTKESTSTCGTVNGNYCQRLHALDITTFAEKFGGPVVIQGSVPGTGNASAGGTLTFDPKIHNQRSSLALANGQISIAWASHEDAGSYHGWVMSYNAANLQQTGIWCSSPDGFMAGVWMSGRGPAVDASGNVYYMVGNGDWNGTRNFGESMVKLGSTPGTPLLDWFTPDSWSSLNAGDVDYGSSGPILIPGTDLIAGAGKTSIFYVMHTGNLGHERAGNGQIVQSLANNGGWVTSGPVYWNRSGGAGPWMYVWSNGCDFLKAYHFNGTTFDTGIVSESTIASPCGASGGVLTLSANGSIAGSGIIWSSMPLADDGDHGVHQGVLRALDADDLTKELWNSRLNAARDDSGNWPKYSPPTVVNGRVYMASFPADGVSSTPLNVYGLLTTAPTPGGLTATAGNAQVSLAWNPSTGAASYNLYRSVNGGAYSQLNTSPITTTSYTDSGLTNGTPYCYEVTGVNPSGESAKSSPACATPQPPPPPLAISLIQKATFSRQPTSGGTVTLTLPQATAAGHTLIVGVSFWPLDISSVTDGSGDTFTRGLATSVYHNVSGSATYTNFYYAKSTAGGATSLTLNFSGGSTYLLVAVAEVAGLNPSAPLDQSGYQESLTAMAAWSSATVTTTAANEYQFSWISTEASNPTCASPATGWVIESQTNDAAGATVCLLDRVVSATGSYQASVTASTAQNYAMEIATFKGNAPPGPPPTPTGLTATAGNAQVSLAWNPSTGAASYNLYRSVSGGAYSRLNGSPITMTSYTDTGLTNGTQYCYELTAVNPSGESAKSSPVCATPQPPPPPLAISLIQKATFSNQPTSGGTVTLTLPQATAAGHTLIVGVSFWPLDISSVTDGSGDTFTRGLATSVYHNVSGSATYTNFYYAKSTAGGTTSLTLSFSGGSTYLLVAVAEVAGLDSAAPLDQSGFNESLTAASPWTSASVTTTVAVEYLFSWSATEAGDPPCSSPASGWTIESQTNDPSGATVCGLDRIVSATGTYQASVTPSTAQNYTMVIVTLK